ncbi:MAG: GAF domain-containing protein [Acidimicrobiales bacterium]
MLEVSRPTYRAVIQAAVDSTGSSRGWLLGVGESGFTVLAAHGHPMSGAAVGQRREVRGAAGFAAASGQPAAMQIAPDDSENAGAGGVEGMPSALLAVPCGVEDVAGVIELVDPVNGSYSFDDVETVTLLADVVGAALSEDDSELLVPAPAALAAGLATLAGTDAVRYAAVARAVEALL